MDVITMHKSTLIDRNFEAFLKARDPLSPSSSFKEYVKARVEKFRREREIKEREARKKLEERAKYGQLTSFVEVDITFLASWCLNPSTKKNDHDILYDRYDKGDDYSFFDRYKQKDDHDSSYDLYAYDLYAGKKIMHEENHNSFYDRYDEDDDYGFFNRYKEEEFIKTEKPKPVGDVDDHDISYDLFAGKKIMHVNVEENHNNFYDRYDEEDDYGFFDRYKQEEDHDSSYDLCVGKEVMHVEENHDSFYDRYDEDDDYDFFDRYVEEEKFMKAEGCWDVDNMDDLNNDLLFCLDN